MCDPARMQTPHATRGPAGGRLGTAWFALLLTTAVSVRGAEPARVAVATATPDPLATKQQIARDRMTQLEDRMFRVAEKLAEAEPEQAQRLESALRRARELLIRRHMDEIIVMLEGGHLTDASDRQLQVNKDLERILELLLEDPDNSEERQAEIDRLQEYRNRVNELLEEERALKARADAVPRLEQLLAAIRAAIARLQALIARQDKLSEQTEAAGRTADRAAAGRLGDAQKGIRADTEGLEQEMGRPAGAISPPGASPERSPQPGREDRRDPSRSDERKEPGSRDDSERSPTPTPSGQSPAPGTPDAEGTPGAQGSPDNPRPTGRPDGSESAEPQGEQAVEAGARKAREEVGQAGREMKVAQNELGDRDLSEAVPMQEKAGQSLRRALKQLEKQAENAQQLLDQAQAAKKQRELRQRAEELAREMKKPSSGDEKQDGPSPSGQQGDQQKGGQQGGQQGKPQQGDQQQGDPQQGGSQQGGQQGETPDQPPAPGSHSVEQAGENMDDAADDLDKNEPAEASRDQQKAIDQLEQAREELEQALDQLRREQQEQLLRGLESRFRAMLAKQLAINQDTVNLETKGRKAWVHADTLRLAGAAQDESALADQAGQALLILEEEGTTIVFPVIVEQLREDMQEVARRLREKKTGTATQRIEADVVTALEELIEAIKDLRKQRESGEMAPGGGGQSQNPPLLPDSAELKLLRSCQQRVNRQTLDAFETYDPSQDEPPSPEARRDLDRVADRQQKVADMARKMNERMTGQ